MELSISRTSDGYLSIILHRKDQGDTVTLYANTVASLVSFIDMMKDYEKVSLRFDNMHFELRESIINEIRKHIKL